MGARAKFAAVLIGVALFGCKAPLGSTAANASEGGDGGSSGGVVVSASGGTRVESVPDTTMNNETAFYVKIPASWKFQGVLLQGGPATCDPYFMLSWRAKSADGQSFIEQMPQQLLVYGNGPKPARGCLPIDGPMSVQDFLKHIAAMMQLNYLADDPMPEENAKLQQQWQEGDAKAAAFYAARDLTPPRNEAEISSAVVGFKSGSVAMKGRLTALLHCIETTQPGMKSMLRGIPDRPAATADKCTADVYYLAAPENQYAALVQEWKASGMGAKQNQEWGDAWVKRYAEQGNAMNTAIINKVNDQFAKQRQEIAHTMAVQQQVHDQFLATMQRGTDISIATTYDAMNARSTAASDMVDFSLDRQTVMNTNTGELYKITNQVTVGGALQQVHGNGTPW